jgi:hypothetical protein
MKLARRRRRCGANGRFNCVAHVSFIKPAIAIDIGSDERSQSAAA